MKGEGPEKNLNLEVEELGLKEHSTLRQTLYIYSVAPQDTEGDRRMDLRIADRCAS